MKTIRQYRLLIPNELVSKDYEYKTEWRYLNGKKIESLQRETRKGAKIEYREIVVNKQLKRTRDFKNWNYENWILKKKED